MRSCKELTQIIEQARQEFGELRVIIKVLGGEITVEGLQPSEKERMGEKRFEEIDQAFFELEEGYGSNADWEDQ